MKSAAVTDVGKVREINQDTVFASEKATGILPCLFLVADGMGGHNAGDFASKFCVEELVEQIKAKKGRTWLGCLESAVQTVNDLLIKKSAEDEKLSGMGTTLVGATTDGKTCLVMNIGDSRMYLSRGESLIQISQDHSLVESMVRNGEIERRDAMHHPQKNVITRALGVADKAVPDFFEIDVLPGDKLLLCSDGLTNMVDDETVNSVLTERGSLKNKAEKLITMANDRGGTDNISIVLVEI